MSKPQRRRTSIDDLPAELLTKIFHLVHYDSIEELYAPASDDPYDKKWFLRPVLFLRGFRDTLTLVSLRWQTIVSYIPEFWTVHVFVIDAAQPIPFSHIQTSLERSSDLLLDIFVTRHPNCPRLDSDNERSILLPLLAILIPHIHRFRSFSFYAIHSSALPKLVRVFSCNLPHLVSLRLECEIDDGDANPAPGWGPLWCPILKTLVLDGHNFINMTNMDRLWPLQVPQLQSLSIIRLAPLSNEDTSRLSIYDFLDALTRQSLKLKYLRLCGAEFTNPFSEEYFAELNLSKALVLEDLSPSFVPEFLFPVKLHTPELHVTRCSLNAMGTLPSTLALRLEEIGEFDNLIVHLKHWSGTAITFVRCAGVNDELLDMLGTVSRYTGAAHLAKLTILDCPNFTINALKKMVDLRNQKVGERAEWPGHPAIEELTVSGKGPSLGTEDREWLCSRLKSLNWRTVADGGGGV
ncbi:hypothetical protein FPV67DRAFT_1449862 [Lyophyllum atratum]|nr:hypothetical protein FPV67DRAFT_1449862 [Lyophyllum atratum]